MSYDLVIWSCQPTLTEEDAEELAYDLLDGKTTETEPSDAVASFVEEVTDKYPRLSELEPGQDTPWASDISGSGAHVVLCIARSKIDTANWIADVAKKHNLCLFDPQDGDYRPASANQAAETDS